MKPGPYFSESGAPRRRIAARLGPALLLLAASLVSAQVPLPPPPPNAGETPARPAAPAKAAEAPRRVACPRCGYACEPEWHYCLACGWDRTRLTGADEEATLKRLARATVRVLVNGRAEGTAFPYGSQGLFVTSAHLLFDRAIVRFQAWNNDFFDGTVLGIDAPSGIAVVRPDQPRGPGLEVAPDPPVVRDETWAVCYPVEREGGEERLLHVSLHRGRLTATGQSGTHYVAFEDLLRTDHSVENGCSGGPLLDARGRLIGMILGWPDDGLTYSLPLLRLRPVLESLERHQQPAWPYFGIALVAPDERRLQKFHLDPATAHPIVADVLPTSPAAQAAVRAGEVLTAVDGHEVTTVWEAGSRLLQGKVGASVRLSLGSGNSATRQVDLAPLVRPQVLELEPIVEMEESLEANLVLSDGRGGTPKGFVIRDLARGGRGEQLSFRNGDMITSVENHAVDSAKKFNDAVRGLQMFRLEMRHEGGEQQHRVYIRLFPLILAPPVY